MWASPGADVDDLEEAEEDDEEDAALGPSMDFAVSESRTIHRNPPVVHSPTQTTQPESPVQLQRTSADSYCARVDDVSTWLVMRISHSYLRTHSPCRATHGMCR